MKKDIVKMYKRSFDTIIDDLEHYIMRNSVLVSKFAQAAEENAKLQNENGYLKALFDKEGDTQVIKYNGKLYRIVSTSHFHDVGEADTLDINVEMSEELFADDIKSIEKVEKKITAELRNILGIGAKVHLVNPKTIARSEGKAKRVIDNRKLH